MKLKKRDWLKPFRLILCRFGHHSRGIWSPEGIKCEDCGYFKSKEACMSDMYGGYGL